jgi:FKBP-type peptidyl-prolyl cis-trans isomerase FkpA
MRKITGQKIRLLIPALVLFFTSPQACNMGSEYSGFSRAGSGIYYRLNSIGDSDRSPVPGDYLTVDILYSTLDDSLFFSARRKFRLEQPAYKGSVEECLMMMNMGDKAEFIINADDFFHYTLDAPVPGFLSKTGRIRISVNMLDIQTVQSYSSEMDAFLGWIEGLGEYERVRLQNYLKEEKLDVKPDNSGIYYIPLKEGRGKKVEPGDTIEVHYDGRFLNGRFFDSTRRTDEVFQYIYGHDLQVLEGLDRAIGLMHEGGRALVILPSELAFGEYGSSTGIIPPYTSLIYEVEILSVR